MEGTGERGGREGECKDIGRVRGWTWIRGRPFGVRVRSGLGFMMSRENMLDITLMIFCPFFPFFLKKKSS